MGSRRDAGILDKCLSDIRSKQALLRDARFVDNYIAIQQELGDLRGQKEEVTDIRDRLDDVKKSRGHTKEFEAADNEHLLLEDAQLQRKRCLETLLYVSEVENLFQNVQTDFEDRALYLSNRHKVFESVYRGEDVAEASRMHRECVYALRHSWSWLSDLTQCMDVHLKNAGEFHQFHHDVKHLDADMHTFLQWLNTEPFRKPVQTRDPELMSSHFRIITNQLLDYQARVERLCERSKSVYPIYFRKEMPPYPLRATALVTYSHQQITLEKDESVTVIDNSDPERWQVKTGSGKEVEVPAIILVIPPPDPKSFIEAQRLRSQLQVHWDTTVQTLRRQLVQFMTLVAKETQSREFAGLTSNQKSVYMKLLNDATHLLRPSVKEDEDFAAFKTQMTNIRKVISGIKPGQRDVKNGTVNKWNSTNKTFQTFTELLTYTRTFKKDTWSRREEEHLVVRDLDNPPTFTSKAYFERALPVVDIDNVTKESRVTTVRSEIYIHERHRPSRRPVAAPRKRPGLNVSMSSKKRDGLEEEFSETTEYSEERKTFVITGVIDPRNQQTLTVFQALSKGVLNQKHGTYNNPDTDYSISIPEAIGLGYILVEYRDHFANGDISQNGVSGLQNSIDTKTFDVTGIIDPRTGEWISVKDAIAAGILNLKTGKFKNPVTGEEMSILDAIKAGYLMADPALFAEQAENGAFMSVELADVNYKISGVIDPTTGEEISLKRAIQDGIIDIANGLYRDPVTGEVMSIAEAIKRGLIKGRPFDPSRDKDEGDVLKYQQLQVQKQTFVAAELDSVDGFELASAHIDPNELMYSRIREKIDTSARGIKDPKSIKTLTIDEAFEMGILNFAKVELDTLDGEILPLEEATARGLIEPSVLKEILKTYQEGSVGELIESGKFDPDTGLVTDPVTGLTQSLQAAISQKIIDPTTTFFYDVPSHRVMSLQTAMDSGRCNLKTGRIVKPDTGEEISVSEAIDATQIFADINPGQLAEHAETIAKLRGVMDTTIKGVRIPTTNEVVSIEEAVSCGALNVPVVAYADVKVSEDVPLQVAVKRDQMEPQAALALFTAFNKLSLQESIQSGCLDPRSGKFVREDTHEAIPVDVAQTSGHWNPNYVYFVDNETGHVTSLGNFMERGKFDPQSGKVISSASGKAMTIEQAIAKGLITPSIEPERFVDTSTTLKDLIDNGKVNPRSTQFVAPQ